MPLLLVVHGFHLRVCWVLVIFGVLVQHQKSHELMTAAPPSPIPITQLQTA